MKKVLVLVIGVILLVTGCGLKEKTYDINVVDSITQIVETYTLDEGDYISTNYGKSHEGYYISGFSHNDMVYSINERFEVYEDTTITVLYEPYLYSVAYYERDDSEVIQNIVGEFNKMFLMTSTNRILAIGSNQKGELGLSHNEYISVPFDITSQFDLVEGEIITDININGNAVFFSTNHDRYFILGETEYSAKRDMYQMPFDITMELGLEANETIVEISGSKEYYLLTSLGKVFRLLYIDKILEVVNITESFNLEPGDYIEHIYCDLTSFATSKNGEIYGWGLNNKGQVGDNHIDFDTVDFLEYDDSVSKANIEENPIRITSNFQLNEGESIKDIQSQQDISYFITSEERMFVTGHLFLDDIFREHGGTNYQYTNIPIDVTNKLGLEEDEVIIESFNMNNLIIYVTDTSRKIAVGHGYMLIPSLHYSSERFMDVTKYLPETIKAVASFEILTLLDNANQLYAVGRYDEEVFETFKDITDVENIATLSCNPNYEDVCIEFTHPTNITELYDLGYIRISSEIIPYANTLDIPNTFIEMYELKQGSLYISMPNYNLYFVID